MNLSKTQNQGFTLIETLVSIFILGVGLLGMLGVVVNSLKLSSSSNYRTIAAQQAYSIAEALRANPPTLATAATEAVFSSPPIASVTTDCLTVTSCARADYIGSEFRMWQDQLATLLPVGRGTICRDSDPATHSPTITAGDVSDWRCTPSDGAAQYVVKICWNEARISASKVSLSSDFLCTWTNI